MEGMLDQAPDGSTDYAGRHTEPEGPKLLPDDYSHANEDSKPLERSELRTSAIESAWDLLRNPPPKRSCQASGSSAFTLLAAR